VTRVLHVVLASVTAVGGLSCAGQEPVERLMVSTVVSPAAAGSMAPNLSVSGEQVLLSWLEPEAGDHLVRFSRLDRGFLWSPAATVARGSDLFVNWADFPSVEMAPGGFLLAHWLQKSGPGTYAYDVRLARSDDGGTTWLALGTAHDDGTPTEHGFVSLLPEGEGIRAFWLDGRDMTPEAAPHSEGHGGGGSMTLRTAVIGEGIGESEVLDQRTCECCQTAAAMTSAGPVVVYRDRTEEEVRDISIVRRDGGGWTRPEPVYEDGWVVPGCPVNGPAIASGNQT